LILAHLALTHLALTHLALTHLALTHLLLVHLVLVRLIRVTRLTRLLLRLSSARPRERCSESNRHNTHSHESMCVLRHAHVLLLSCA